MKYYRKGGVGRGFWGVKRIKWLNFGVRLDLRRWVNKQNTINVVAYPDYGVDSIVPEVLWLAFQHHYPTFINEYCQSTTNQVDRDWDSIVVITYNDLP